MIDIDNLLKMKKLTRDLTGLPPKEFKELIPKFEQAWRNAKIEEAPEGEEQMTVGPSGKGFLKTFPEKLCFILFYYHCRPSYGVLKFLFDYSPSSARQNIKLLTPVLEAATGRKATLPKTGVETIDEFLVKYPEAKSILITEASKGSEKVKVELSGTVQQAPQTNIVERITQQLKEEFKKQFEKKGEETTTQPSITQAEGDVISSMEEGKKLLEQIKEERLRDQKQKEEAKKVLQEKLQQENAEAPAAPMPEKTLPPSEDTTVAPEQTPQEQKPEWLEKLEHKLEKEGPAKQPIASTKSIEQFERSISKKLNEVKKKINDQLGKPSEELSIIEFVDAIVQEGYFSRASDIHVEPRETDTLVRLRIDGVLHDVVTYPKLIHSAVITRIKVISGLRTDEHQAAQDGRFKAGIQDIGYVDVRVSIVPTYYGENSVMRILTQHQQYTLEEIGLVDRDLELIKEAIKQPYGMILSTGPTGSGKTTSLYAIIRLLNTRDVAIHTIEDPIEYSIQGIDQIQVNARTGLTFANCLRALLRQDPNIIMVGEIRDEETAGIAVNAALTGHLLLSTLHTNDAATALPRLTDMGIEPFLIASTVNIIIGQRLVRKICEHCKEAYALPNEEFVRLSGLVSEKILSGHRNFFKGKGCEICEGSGYKGRIGIFETLPMEENIKILVMGRASSDDVKYVAIKNGMTTMLEDGLKKAVEGKTTVEEVLRVAKE